MSFRADGAQAARDGQPFGANPHDPGMSFAHEEWALGWQQEQPRIKYRARTQSCLRHGCDGTVDGEADFCSIECVPTEASRAALTDRVRRDLADTMPGVTWVERPSQFGPAYDAPGGGAWTARGSDVDPEHITLTISIGGVEATGTGTSVRDALDHLAADLRAAVEAVRAVEPQERLDG